MNWQIKLLIEKHTKENLWFATKDKIVPSKEIDECPKITAAKFLEQIVGYKIDPYYPNWLHLELCDTSYDLGTKTAYLVYVCRVPSDTLLTEGFEWTQYNDILPQIQEIKGVL